MNRESQGNTSLSPWNYKGFTLAEMAVVVLFKVKTGTNHE